MTAELQRVSNGPDQVLIEEAYQQHRQLRLKLRQLQKALLISNVRLSRC